MFGKITIGKKYGMLQVLEHISRKPSRIKCVCKCGNTVVFSVLELKYRTDCGCKNKIFDEYNIVDGVINPHHNKPINNYPRVLHNTRAECGNERPCPFVSCKYHLYSDIINEKFIKLSQPAKDISEMEETCVLDLVDKKGELKIEEIGKLYGLSIERIRQIEEKALKKIAIYDSAKKLREYRGVEIEREMKQEI